MPIDAAKCQACGEPNGCCMAAASDAEKALTACWCKDLALGEPLRNSVAMQYPEQQCLCSTCMKKIKAASK